MERERFEFGKNWKQFLSSLNRQKILEAEHSLSDWLGIKDLSGKTFLDIGSGSGLFSLAAKNLGAEVYSFDYDKDSVECTRHLKEKFYKNDKHWQIEQGDILDKKYLSKFNKYDIVYSWGVLHHTGNMYQALANASDLVGEKGTLFISIYNDQGRKSRNWKKIKKMYNKSPKALRFFILIPCFIDVWFPAFIYDFMRLKPFHTWRTYNSNRGMTPWRDFIDWVGGYPFEVATPEEIFDFFHSRGFSLERLQTNGKGIGCNQFVFKRQ